MFAAMTRTAEKWRDVKISDHEGRQMAVFRPELDHEHEDQTGLKKSASKAKPKPK